MSKWGTQEWYQQVAEGNIPGYSIVHKFGAGNVGTTLVPITQSGTYQTPTTAQALEFVSTAAADALNGAGMREITITGLDANWNKVVQVIAAHATDGTIAVAIPTSLIRLMTWKVSSSGTYATDITSSHVGVLTIQASGGGTVWSTIPTTPFPSGRSQIGAYTIPTGFTGYLMGKLIYTDTNKVADVYFFERNNADDVTTPYSGVMSLIEREVGVVGGFDHHFTLPKNGFVGPCDLGAMAKVTSGTADVSIEFELLLKAD